jgi:hypothetical protein
MAEIISGIDEPISNRETLGQKFMQGGEPRGIAMDGGHHPNSGSAPQDGKFLVWCRRRRRLGDSTGNKHVGLNI